MSLNQQYDFKKSQMSKYDFLLTSYSGEVIHCTCSKLFMKKYGQSVYSAVCYFAVNIPLFFHNSIPFLSRSRFFTAPAPAPSKPFRRLRLRLRPKCVGSGGSGSGSASLDLAPLPSGSASLGSASWYTKFWLPIGITSTDACPPQ